MSRAIERAVVASLTASDLARDAAILAKLEVYGVAPQHEQTFQRLRLLAEAMGALLRERPTLTTTLAEALPPS